MSGHDTVEDESSTSIGELIRLLTDHPDTANKWWHDVNGISIGDSCNVYPNDELAEHMAKLWLGVGTDAATKFIASEICELATIFRTSVTNSNTLKSRDKARRGAVIRSTASYALKHSLRVGANAFDGIMNRWYKCEDMPLSRDCSEFFTAQKFPRDPVRSSPRAALSRATSVVVIGGINVGSTAYLPICHNIQKHCPCDVLLYIPKALSIYETNSIVSPSAMVEELLVSITEYTPNNIILVAHSAGGYVASSLVKLALSRGVDVFSHVLLAETPCTFETSTNLWKYNNSPINVRISRFFAKNAAVKCCISETLIENLNKIGIPMNAFLTNEELEKIPYEVAFFQTEHDEIIPFVTKLESLPGANLYTLPDSNVLIYHGNAIFGRSAKVVITLKISTWLNMLPG